MKKVRVAVAGMGLMGDVHTKVLLSLENVEVVGVAESDVSRHEKIRETYGVPVYSDINELLPKVDAITVCTPDNMHKDIILNAFKNGVKVLVEKPLEVSSDICEEIIEAMPDPTYLMVGHILRFDPRVWRAKQAIENGQLGKIYNIRVRRSNSMWAGKKIGQRTSITWFLGIHDIDMVLWLTGLSVKKAYSVGKKIMNEYWDNVFSIFEMDNGAIMSMENNWILPDQRISTLDAGLNIIGEKGMIEVDFTHNDFRITTNESGCSKYMDTYMWPMWEGVPYGDLSREIESFIDCVIHNKVPLVTAKQATEAVKVVQMVEDILKKQDEDRA